MDADCLIKLTKAQLKEDVCAAFEVAVPSRVRREIMVNASDHPECTVVGRNFDGGALQEISVSRHHAKGEDAAVAAYVEGQHAGIASDDKRFIKKLRLLGIPYLTPTVLVLLLVRKGHICVEDGAAKLDALAPMVSDAEMAIAKTKLDALKHKEA